jgi:hypothetical protein
MNRAADKATTYVRTTINIAEIRELVKKAIADGKIIPAKPEEQWKSPSKQ